MRLQPDRSNSTPAMIKLQNIFVQVKLKLRMDGYLAICSEDKKLIDIHFVSFSGTF